MFRKSPWRPRHHILQAELPHRLKSWLDVPSSLTVRLKAACGSQFNVQVLAERWERPTPEEQLRQVEPGELRRWPLEVGDQRLWARRSILEVAGRPLLVMEVFLPALEYGQAYR
jgi:chorismate-pyruvate lyase